MNDERREERRKHGGLSDEQVEKIKDAILASIYEDIGRSVVKKFLWAIGAAVVAFVLWAQSKGWIEMR